MSPNLDQLIHTLKKEGLDDLSVKSFLESLTRALSSQLYLMIVDVLEAQDLENLKNIENQELREAEMKRIFERKTGQDLQNLSDEFVKNFTDSFLKDYHSKAGQ